LYRGKIHKEAFIVIDRQATTENSLITNSQKVELDSRQKEGPSQNSYSGARADYQIQAVVTTGATGATDVVSGFTASFEPTLN
jgi:hypothetical protein